MIQFENYQKQIEQQQRLNEIYQKEIQNQIVSKKN